jgi:hypothetical protein
MVVVVAGERETFDEDDEDTVVAMFACAFSVTL